MPSSPSSDRAGHILSAALDHHPADQDVFLVTACGEDAALLAEVRTLLASHKAAIKAASDATMSDDLDATIKQDPRLAPSHSTVFLSEQPGDHIGPYKLLQQIGEGGFGTVWMADQEKPVRRRVALKIIKLGMDTKEIVARFEQERQALALMDHPNIAKVLDAGATDKGRPFFVMELVRGVKITEYCDHQRLSTKERVELFIHICHAIQHAHQKGIIHRDLKPSNILVTINDGKAVPKVIDFGVAKATQGRLTDGTLFTQFEQMIGTPIYMSPEQAEMTSLDVDTRSDIYSLGVLLYELLTGRTPIDTTTIAKAGMGEIRRLIREVDPPRPSARVKTLAPDELTTMAKRRHTEPDRLTGTLRGDIDWIVMKCLEKDRQRRYDTANGLASDLQRHLANEVVIARPPTTAYLLSKLIQRNKLAFAAATAIAATLVIGIAASMWQAVRANRALDELRATAPAFAEQARGLAAKEHFDDAIAKLDYAIKLRPDAPEYLVAKGDLLQCQLKLADAAAIYREALRVKPGVARTEASAKLCDELLAAPTTEQGKLTRESLAKLHLAMQKQQRPAAELMPVARLLGEEKKLIVEYWLARLKDLPVSAEKPLKDRLEAGDDGLLKLDLSGTKIADLAPLTGMPLGDLNLSSCDQITDFVPLHEFRSLTSLFLNDTEISDLTPLRGLPLEDIGLNSTRVFDISALRGMKLKSLGLRSTRVADLSPLAKMPLANFDATAIPATDYSPLAGAPLKVLLIQNSQLRDLSFLKDSPLKELSLDYSNAVRGYAVLAGLKSLDLLRLPSSYRELPDEELAAIAALRTHPTLKNIEADHKDGSRLIRTSQSKDIFWQDWDREQTFVPAIRASGIQFSLTKLPTGSYSLEIMDQPLRDLSILKGAPISKFTCARGQITDLTPLHDLPIEYLNLGSNPITDLSPLRGMHIKTLYLSGTKVSDLSPLTSLPLKEIYLGSCENVTDVAVLAEIPTLEKIVVPVQAANIEALRKLTKLQRLAFQTTGSSPWIPITTAEEFWQQWPGMAWARAMNDAGMKYTAYQDAEGKWSITVTAKNFSDCSIFKGALIRDLTLSDTAVSDLSPLRGMTIKKLWLRGTKVADLEPLRGMALRELTLCETKVTDLRPIEGMPLDWLNLRGTSVKDLSVLRGMPLVNLWLNGCTELTDLSPLAEAKTLNKLFLPPNPKSIEFLRALPGLQWIDFTEYSVKTKTATEFWKEYDSQGWLKELRKSGLTIKTAKQLPDGTWDVDLRNTEFSDLTILKGAPISSLNLDNTAVSDLSPLRGMALKTLTLNNTAVSDLSPLRGMALKTLTLNHTKVTDLSPLQGTPLEELNLYSTRVTNIAVLRGMPLKTLDLSGTVVTDLEPLRGMALKKLRLNNTKVAELRPLEQMPLEFLYLHGTKVTDLSALRGMPLTLLKLHDCTELTDLSPLTETKNLTDISLPLNAKNLEFLRAFPKLERIDFKSDPKSGYKSAADFWKEYDTQGWLRILRASGAKISAQNQLPDGTWDLRIRDAEFSDLTLLRGARISSLEIYGTAVADLTPLRGMPIKKLWIAGTKVTDISALAELPLESLTLHGTAVPDLSPLLKCRTLKSITLPTNARNVSVLHALTALERISYSLNANANPAQTAAEFWKDHNTQGWATALRASGAKINVLKQLPDGTWEVDIPDPKFSDLSILSGAPISSLRIGQTAVTDLTPLRGMVIKKLYIFDTNVTDLSPLKGMQLDLLNLARTKITDYSAVRGLPIKHLCLDSTRVVDLRPFEELPLTTLRLSGCAALTDLSLLVKFKELKNLTLPEKAKDIEFLRALPQLERIGFADDPKIGYLADKTAAQFWTEYDMKKK